MYQVLIRPLIEEDALISYKWRNDPDVWKYTGNRPNIKITPEIELEWIKQVLAAPDQKRFAIIVDEQYIGNIQLTNIDTANKCAEYHIFIGEKAYWGKGIAYQASFQLLYYAKEILLLDEVYLSVKEDNISAINLYKKCGFNEVEKNNEWYKLKISLSNLELPVISVFVLVYNHGQYLKQCLDGILMQKLQYPFNIVVGEDCSKDNSRDILLAYQKKYPGKFKLLLHDTNIGAMANQFQTFKNCSGKYIAICEGDDYWTDPYKLQKQVDFLEANPDYGLIHTACQIVDKNNVVIDNCYLSDNANAADIFELYLRKEYSIATLTVLFRSDLFTDVVKLLSPSVSLKMTDLPLWLEISRHSKVKYLNDVTSAYRRLPNSASHFEDPKKNLSFYINALEIREFFANKYNVKLPVNRMRSKIYGNQLRECFVHRVYDGLGDECYRLMIKYNYLSIFNPRPLLFLLGCKSNVFKALVLKLQNSNHPFIKKHFS